MQRTRVANVEEREPLSHEPRPVSTPEPPLSQWDRKFVLSLDGGGVRGLSTLHILAELMAKIALVEQHLNADATHSFHPDPFLLPKGPNHADQEGDPASRYLPCHYFDLIVGISTGGLIAIMLGRLRMSVRDCIHEYQALSKQVFQNPKIWHIKQKHKLLRNPLRDKYDTKPLREVIEKVIRERNLYPGSESLKIPAQLCQNVIFACEGRSGKNLFPLTSHDRRRAQTSGAVEADSPEVIDVALAATAAPGYFKPYDVKGRRFFDAGVMKVNPSKEALFELEAFFRGRHDLNRGALAGVLSLGTGKLRVKSNIFKDRKWYQWRYGDVLDYLKNQATNPAIAHADVQRYIDTTNDGLARNGCGFQINYTRVSVVLENEAEEDEDLHLPHNVIIEIEKKLAGIKLDGWSETMASDIEAATIAFVRTNKIQERLLKFAEDLVTLRRLRSNAMHTSGPIDADLVRRWYRYASASQWFCSVCRTTVLSHKAIAKHLHDYHGSGFSIEKNARRIHCEYPSDNV